MMNTVKQTNEQLAYALSQRLGIDPEDARAIVRQDRTRVLRLLAELATKAA